MSSDESGVMATLLIFIGIMLWFFLF